MRRYAIWNDSTAVYGVLRSCSVKNLDYAAMYLLYC